MADLYLYPWYTWLPSGLLFKAQFQKSFQWFTVSIRIIYQGKITIWSPDLLLPLELFFETEEESKEEWNTFRSYIRKFYFREDSRAFFNPFDLCFQAFRALLIMVSSYLRSWVGVYRSTNNTLLYLLAENYGLDKPFIP